MREQRSSMHEARRSRVSVVAAFGDADRARRETWGVGKLVERVSEDREDLEFVAAHLKSNVGTDCSVTPQSRRDFWAAVGPESYIDV